MNLARVALGCVNKILSIAGLRIERKQTLKRLSSDEVWKCCLKYKHVLDELPELQSEAPDGPPTKKIWQFWWQGVDTAPAVVKSAMESVQRHCAGYDIVIIDKTNYADYVDVPQYIIDKILNGGGGISHLSDYIRVALLAKYGGIWLDATIFLTAPIPQEIAAAKFFSPILPYWAILGRTPSLELEMALSRMAYPDNNGLTITSWMFVAQKDSRMILALKALQEAYWRSEDKVVEYLLIQYLATMAAVCNRECGGEVETMPKFDTTRCNLLRRSWMAPFAGGLFDEIKKLSMIHKLTYKGVPETVAPETILGCILSGKAV